MKRVFYNKDIFKLLREIDAHYMDAPIGITVLQEEIPEKDLKQLYSNGWHFKNKYFLILDEINKETISTLLSIVKLDDFFKGICVNCPADTKQLQQLISVCSAKNMFIFLVQDKLTEEQRFLPYAKVVDTLYDI